MAGAPSTCTTENTRVGSLSTPIASRYSPCCVPRLTGHLDLLVRSAEEGFPPAEVAAVEERSPSISILTGGNAGASSASAKRQRQHRQHRRSAIHLRPMWLPELAECDAHGGRPAAALRQVWNKTRRWRVYSERGIRFNGRGFVPRLGIANPGVFGQEEPLEQGVDAQQPLACQGNTLPRFVRPGSRRPRSNRAARENDPARPTPYLSRKYAGRIDPSFN